MSQINYLKYLVPADDLVNGLSNYIHTGLLYPTDNLKNG